MIYQEIVTGGWIWSLLNFYQPLPQDLLLITYNTDNCFQANADISFVLFFLRTSEINLFYNLQVFYWHFLEILWLFIFLILYLWYILNNPGIWYLWTYSRNSLMLWITNS